jgi:hypothetical protein
MEWNSVDKKFRRGGGAAGGEYLAAGLGGEVARLREKI